MRKRGTSPKPYKYPARIVNTYFYRIFILKVGSTVVKNLENKMAVVYVLQTSRNRQKISKLELKVLFLFNYLHFQAQFQFNVLKFINENMNIMTLKAAKALLT